MMSLSSIHIEGDEQLSFNKAYSILNKYFVDSVKSNQRIDYTFQVKKSNNDLDLDNAIRLFYSYAMLYKTPGEYVCEVEHLDFGFDKYIFYVPKDSKLYKLICNYENEFKNRTVKNLSFEFDETKILNKLQIESLINQKVMETQDYGFTQGFAVTVDPMPLKGYAKFPNLSPKSKFKTGDKVKIINDFMMDIKRESVNFKGFEGIVNDVIFDNFSFKFDYTIAINGRTTGLINESALELIEQSKKLEYRKDLYDIADDVDGCLLPDYQPKTELIQRKIS